MDCLVCQFLNKIYRHVTERVVSKELVFFIFCLKKNQYIKTLTDSDCFFRTNLNFGVSI